MSMATMKKYGKSLTKIPSITKRKKVSSELYSTLASRKRFATTKGNIITFKRTQYSAFKRQPKKQMLLKSVKVSRKGDVEVEDRGSIVYFDSLEYYLSAIDWKEMRRMHSGNFRDR